MIRATCLALASAIATSACGPPNLVIRADRLTAGTVPVRIASTNTGPVVIERTREEDLRTPTPFVVQYENLFTELVFPSSFVCAVPCTTTLPVDGLDDETYWSVRLQSKLRVALRAPTPEPGDVFSVRLREYESTRSALEVAGYSAFIAGLATTVVGVAVDVRDDAPDWATTTWVLGLTTFFLGIGLFFCQQAVVPRATATLVREEPNEGSRDAREAR